MADYGIKITLPENSFDNESSNIVIDSSQKVLKVQSNADPAHSNILEYTFLTTPAADSTTNLFTIDHGYNYTPMAIVFWSPNRNDFYLMPATVALDFGIYSLNLRYKTNETSLLIDFVIIGTPPSVVGNTYYIKYYISTEDGVTN